MQDKVVMGDQNDGLRGLTRFSDNEGDIIWPAWRAELEQRVAFEFGKIGNQITGGEVKESDADHQGGQQTRPPMRPPQARARARPLRIRRFRPLTLLPLLPQPPARALALADD